MAKSKSIFIFVIMLLLLISIVTAKSGHMTLLAVSEVNGSYRGSIADLYLDIVHGSGRVFLDTFPLTKFDTQISTRFAKEIACSYIDTDCSRYDFFYTIDSNSPIIAGASAGAAISTLTISLLENLDYDGEIAVTGTINSGGLVGPVGGIKEKIEAAQQEGIRKVIIPKGAKILVNDNETITLYNFSKTMDIEIVEVSTLAEVVEHFTGEKLIQKELDIDISDDYRETMETLANELCNRTDMLFRKIGNINENKSYHKAKNLSMDGKDILRAGNYYSAASYCFGANVELSYLILQSQNLAEEEIMQKALLIEKSIGLFNDNLDKDKVKTITDLEAYMVVKERLTEAQDFIDFIKKNSTDSLKLYNLAYAIERLNSAKSWATFLDNRGRQFILNEAVLKESCKSKLLEAEERYQYVNLYFPSTLKNIRKELDYAYNDLENKNYALCVFKASKAKASLDIILSVFYLDKEQVENVLLEKIRIVKMNLAKETSKGIFPILGYSYYEYANTLKESDVYSSLLYAEYSLELSNLELYFKEKTNFIQELFYTLDIRIVSVFILGILIGVLIMIIKPSRQKSAGKKR